MMTSLLFVVHYEAYIISLSDFKVSFDCSDCDNVFFSFCGFYVFFFNYCNSKLVE